MTVAVPSALLLLASPFKSQSFSPLPSIFGADEVVAAHGHIAAVLVTKTAHGDAQAVLFLDQLGGENFTEIA